MDHKLTLHNHDTKMTPCPDSTSRIYHFLGLEIVTRFAPIVSRFVSCLNTSIFHAFCTFNMSKLVVNSTILRKYIKKLHDDNTSSHDMNIYIYIYIYVCFFFLYHLESATNYMSIFILTFSLSQLYS